MLQVSPPALCRGPAIALSWGGNGGNVYGNTRIAVVKAHGILGLHRAPCRVAEREKEGVIMRRDRLCLCVCLSVCTSVCCVCFRHTTSRPDRQINTKEGLRVEGPKGTEVYVAAMCMSTTRPCIHACASVCLRMLRPCVCVCVRAGQRGLYCAPYFSRTV